MKDGDQLVSIAENSENGVVTIKTKKDSFEGRKLIICAGTWINQLLQPLGVKLDVKVRSSILFFLLKIFSHIQLFWLAFDL